MLVGLVLFVVDHVVYEVGVELVSDQFRSTTSSATEEAGRAGGVGGVHLHHLHHMGREQRGLWDGGRLEEKTNKRNKEKEQTCVWLGVAGWRIGGPPFLSLSPSPSDEGPGEPDRLIGTVGVVGVLCWLIWFMALN